MAYFTQDFIDFFQQLTTNNNKEWFNANKPRFKKNIEAPFKQFVNDIIMRVHADDPSVMIEAKDAVFRIYRDVRFSKDKTPYKTHMSASISREGRKGMSVPGMYLQLSAEDIRVYGGVYQPDKDQLLNIRTYLSRNLKKLDSLLKAADFKKHFRGEILGEKHKRLAPEFQEAAEKQPLIYNKGFYYYARLDSKWIVSPKLGDKIMELYFAGKPMKEFLTRALEG